MDKPKIPDFTLNVCCGSGAYGDVWIAEDKNGLKRAVKVLNKVRLENLGVLEKELRGLQLYRTKVPKHINLVEIYHVGETDQHIFYVMDLADNLAGDKAKYLPDTMAERLKVKKRFSVDESLYLIEKMLDALTALHDAGLAHRDIKPGNIIYINGVPKLTDIGLITADVTGITLAGTMGFIPPERVSGSETDLYALGKLLYCLYTGNAPEQFPSLPGTLEDTPEAKHLNKVILKACNRNPEKRFKTVDDFFNALEFNTPQSSKKRIIIGVFIFLLVTGITSFTLKTPYISKIAHSFQKQKMPLPQPTYPDISKLVFSDAMTIKNKDWEWQNMSGYQQFTNNGVQLKNVSLMAILKPVLPLNYEIIFRADISRLDGLLRLVIDRYDTKRNTYFPDYSYSWKMNRFNNVNFVKIFTLDISEGQNTIEIKPKRSNIELPLEPVEIRILKKGERVIITCGKDTLFECQDKLIISGGIFRIIADTTNFNMILLSDFCIYEITEAKEVSPTVKKQKVTKNTPIATPEKIKPLTTEEKPKIRDLRKNLAERPSPIKKTTDKSKTAIPPLKKPEKLDLKLTVEEVQAEEAKEYLRTLFFEEKEPELQVSIDPSNMGYGQLIVKKSLPDDFEINLKVKFLKDVETPRNYPKGFFDKVTLTAQVASKDMYRGDRERLGALMYSLNITNGVVSDFTCLAATNNNGKRKEGTIKISDINKLELPIGEWNSLKILKTGTYIRYFLNGKNICGARMTFNRGRFNLIFSDSDDIHFLDFSDLEIFSLSEKTAIKN